MSIKNDKKLILAFETSCDETGVCLLSAEGEYPETKVTTYANELATQIAEHQEYGGVFPSLAKRLHGENLPVLLEKILQEVETKPIAEIDTEKEEQIREWLERHDGLADNLFRIAHEHGLPQLDAVAVTAGPGLEPALWVGINIARSLALLLNTNLIPVNHMEGHLLSGLAPKDLIDGKTHKLQPISFPAVALLVSGGHTELIRVDGIGQYEKIGQTRDDAAGEAFDKVGRLLGLPYPAGPHVSELSAQAPTNEGGKMKDQGFSLPRPMINSSDLDFSFSGLKTAAAREIEAQKPLSSAQRAVFARELEQAIVEVLVSKTIQSIRKTGAQALLVGGGVSANKTLRTQLENIENVALHISPLALAGDNAVMIGLAATMNYDSSINPETDISADSRLSL